jgi:hypothetical protein
MPDGHHPATPQATAMDDQFGTHTADFAPTSHANPLSNPNAAVTNAVAPSLLIWGFFTVVLAWS